MPELKINIIPFDIIAQEVNIYISPTEKEGFIKKKVFKFPNDIQKEYTDKKEYDLLYWSFDKTDDYNIKEYSIRIKEYPTFAKPLIDSILIKYFEGKGHIVFKSFIDDVNIWIKSDAPKVSHCDTYNAFSLKVDYNEKNREYGLLLSYDGDTFIITTPISELVNIQASAYSKAIIDKKVFKSRQISLLSVEQKKTAFPVLNRDLRKALDIKFFTPNPFRNIYKEYFFKIESFYKSYLSGESIGDLIQVFSSGFKLLSENDILNVDKDKSNKLLFGNNETHFNIYNGLKLYGPYKIPEDLNIKFIFIFSKNDKDIANQLYSQFKKGYKSFPGLDQFVSLPFNVETSNSVSFDSENPIDVIKNHFDNATIDTISNKYIALYISPYSKDNEDDSKRLIYYKVKEYLLSKNISSQVVFKDNVLKDDFNYSLPNIAIALLAKAGGVPWRLSRPIGNNLIIGFGAKRENENLYVGNTVAFTNDGVFQKFNSFSSDVLSNLGTQLKEALETYINLFPDKGSLIIHYYKTMNYEEQAVIENTLKKLNLKIPYVVLTINETKSKDYVCFDTLFNGLMPISGTIVKIRRNEFLLCNNTRYGNDTTTRIDGYPLPIKIKISKSDFINTNDEIVVRELIDQVYQFSRMYWKSVRQKSRPVTILYSEIIAEMMVNFENDSLPENQITRETLWFL